MVGGGTTQWREEEKESTEIRWYPHFLAQSDANGCTHVWGETFSGTLKQSDRTSSDSYSGQQKLTS